MKRAIGPGVRISGPDHTPLEAGLGFAVKLDTDIPFLGREALETQRREGVRKILATFTADAGIVLHGRETIYRDGLPVGWLSSAGFGHTVGKSIGLGYVRSDRVIDKDHVLSGNYELEVATERVPCSVHLKPLYDPKMDRLKS